MKPILMVYLSLWKLSNYLKRLINDPFPKGEFILAWYATVGYSYDNTCNHFLVMRVGIRSILLSIRIWCFCGQFFLMCASIN